MFRSVSSLSLEKAKALAATIEMELKQKDSTPIEYRHYVKKRDKESEER